MALSCNIDSAGKAVRFRSGVYLLLAGIALTAAWPLRTGSPLGWLTSGGLLAAGAFSLFEARAGWCVIRALGFRTRV